MFSRRGGLVVALVACVALLWLLARDVAGPVADPGATSSAETDERAGGVHRRDAERGSLGQRSRLAGRVLDLADAPIAGAQVCVAIPSLAAELGWRPRCVTADEGGFFVVDPIAAGRHRLTAAARGFIPPPRLRGPAGLDVAVGPGEARDDLVLRLRPGGAEVRGVIRDITGGTVADALVWSETAMTESDGEGRFSLWLDVRSFVELEIQADGYARAGAVEHRPIGREIEVLLRPEVILAGRVIAAESGAPIADVPVVASAPLLLGYSGSFATQPQVRSGEDGRFRFVGLGPGRYKPQVRASAWRGQASESVLLVIGGPPGEVEIKVHPARRVEGRVVRSGGGEACPDGSVAVHDAAGEIVDRGIADADGSVAIGGLLPGPYDLEVRCAADEPALPPIAVDLREDDLVGARWEVEAPRGRAIRGRVVDADGRGVAMVHVQGELTEPEVAGARALARAITGDDGSFAIERLPAGVYSFYRIDAEGMAPPIEHPRVTLPGDRDVDDLVIRLPRSGALEVRVVDSRGAPVRSAELSVTRVGGGGSNLRPMPDGVWALDPTTPGSYHVKLSRPGVGGKAGPDDPGRSDPGEEVEVVAGRRASITLVTTPRDQSIAGVVRSRDGDLIADAAVWASSGETYVDWGGRSRHPEVARTVTDIDGAFRLEGLEEGTYTLHARDPAGIEEAIDGVATGRSDVAFALPEAGSVAGRVALRGGDPPARFTISLQPADGGRGRSEEFLYTDGAWRISGLPPGAVTVEVQAAEGTAQRKVTIPEGGERDGVTLELAARGGLRGRIVDADTGAPVTGVLATVVSANGRASASDLDPAGTRTSGPDGRFELRQVPSGEVVLHLWPAQARQGGYVDHEVKVVVHPGRATDAGVIRVRRRGSTAASDGDATGATTG